MGKRVCFLGPAVHCLAVTVGTTLSLAHMTPMALTFYLFQGMHFIPIPLGNVSL